MSLIKCEITVDLNRSENCFIVAISVTDSKIYVAVITLSNQDNVKLLEQLKSGFKRAIYLNKQQIKV